ncbi:hypothetical protein HLPCO_000762 [Haloplasma contractile SSD-17B]|uniref:Uncharacterized protein n=1 Tax=Haloplasma contractile SSD-17B TaxID=1033810 RepID=U2EDS8_9MOLU|nr:hypothetical protein HLPCO_000762 [Haloplasma contractile SSD-17B]
MTYSAISTPKLFFTNREHNKLIHQYTDHRLK